MTKSMETYAETIQIGQKINALSEDKEVDIFDTSKPGLPIANRQNSIDVEDINIDHVPDGMNNDENHDGTEIIMRTTNGIADDEFIVEGGESSHDIVTAGEETPRNSSDSHESDNDIIMDMDVYKGIYRVICIVLYSVIMHILLNIQDRQSMKVD